MIKKAYLFIFIFQIIIFSGCSNYEYPPGRDTVEIFGEDGRFQILRGIHSNDLFNVETNDLIESSVVKYIEKEPLIYIIGQSGYTILNYETEKVINYKKLDNIPIVDKKIFEELKENDNSS